MKIGKAVFLTGAAITFTSISALAVPLDINWAGGQVQEAEGSIDGSPGFDNMIPVANVSQTASFSLAGVDSINMTWSAPAGYMYVIEPPPSGVMFPTLFFEAEYSGLPSSLGSITSSSFSVNTVYGTSPLSGEAQAGSSELTFNAIAAMNPNAAAFAFTSLSISADFSGTATSGTLTRTAHDAQAEEFASYYADFEVDGPNPGDYYIPPDMGPFIILEPLSGGNVPDHGGTLALSAIGFAGLLLAARKRTSQVA